MKIRVELTEDLTRYGEGLVVGIKGYAIGAKDIWSRNYDNFTTVIFDNSKKLDVLWKGLKIIDEDYLKEVEMKKAEEKIKLKNAHDIVITYGPNGGFKYLSFKYDNCSTSVGFKSQAQYYIDIFKEYNLEIKSVREKSLAQKKEEKELDSAKNIVLIKNKNGGVKELNYDYISPEGKILNKSIKYKETIERKLKLLDELGKNVKGK